MNKDFFNQYRNHALLFLRIGIGVMFIIHGYGKITGGVETWVKLGMAMKSVGISFLPGFWGFMAAFSEFFGGILLIAGLFTRTISGLLAFTMFIAAVMLLKKGDGLTKASHAIESCILFISLIFIGAGDFSIDEIIYKKLFKKK